MTGAGRRTIAFIVSALLAFGSIEASLAAPPDPRDNLENVEREIEQSRKQRDEVRRAAREAAEEVSRMRRDLVVSAEAIRKLENDALRLEDRIEELEAAEKQATERLNAHRGLSAGVLAAMVRMARFPPEAVIAQPVSPGDTVRAAITLRSAAPLFEEVAAGLRGNLDTIRETRTEIEERKATLADRQKLLDTDRRKLDSLLSERRLAYRTFDAQSRELDDRLQALSRKARDFQDLVERVERERRERAERETRLRAEQVQEAKRRIEAEARDREEREARLRAEEEETRLRAEEEARRLQAIRSIANSKGQLPFPVAGRVVGAYGQRAAKGLTRKGIDIETRGRAQVVAPFDGEVVFAGPFRGYGRILIIDHGEGYHSLLAGLEEIDGIPGHRVIAGEPVGKMGDGGAERPVLYMEFRRDGQPINPLPWLARNGSGVNG